MSKIDEKKLAWAEYINLLKGEGYIMEKKKATVDNKEQFKIVSDGMNSKIFLYGMELQGVQEIKFSQSIEEVPVIELKLLISPNFVFEEHVGCIESQIFRMILQQQWPIGWNLNVVFPIYNGRDGEKAQAFYQSLVVAKHNLTSWPVAGGDGRRLYIDHATIDAPNEASLDNWCVMLKGVLK